MSEPVFITICPIVVKIFHKRAQMSTCWWRSGGKVRGLSVGFDRIYSLGIMKVFT